MDERKERTKGKLSRRIWQGFALLIATNILGVKAQDCLLKGVVQYQNHETQDIEALPGATLLVFSLPEQQQPLSVQVSNASGLFQCRVPAGKSYKLITKTLGYKTDSVVIQVPQDSSSISLAPIILQEDIRTLQSIIVTGSRKQQAVDSRSYTFSPEQKQERNAFQMVGKHVPSLRIDPLRNSIVSSQQKNIKILLNGLPCTDDKLKVIRPKNVKRVVVYDVPPMEYETNSCIVNIITSDLDSGIVGNIDLTIGTLYNGFYPNLSYVKGKHLFTLGADIHVNPKRKIKDLYRGENSYKLEDHEIQNIFERADREYGTQKGLTADYTYFGTKDRFQANLILGRSNEVYEKTEIRRSTRQNKQTESTDQIDAETLSKNISLNLYYQHQISDQDQLILNLVGTHFNNLQSMAYQEDTKNLWDQELSGKKNSLQSEILWKHKGQKLSYSLGYKNSFAKMKEQMQKRQWPSSNAPSTDLERQSHRLYGEIGYRWHQAYLRLGNRFIYHKHEGIGETNSTSVIAPQLLLSYSFNPNVLLRFRSRTSTILPEIQSLSKNTFQIAKDIIRSGNPQLKNETLYRNELMARLTYDKFEIDASLFADFAKDHIYSSFKPNRYESQPYLFKTAQNAHRFTEYGLDLYGSVSLLQDLRLVLSGRAYRTLFQPDPDSETFDKWFFPVQLSLSYQNGPWNIVYLKTFSSFLLNDIYISGREKVSYFSLSYTYKNLMLQASYFFPLMKNSYTRETIDGLKYKEYNNIRLKSKENTFALSISWSFGRHETKYLNKATENSDNDRGVFSIK